MDAWEIALNKINELVLAKRLKQSVPSKEGMCFFECEQGQFALEVPRRTRGVKGAKFWFSFPPMVPHGIEVEAKAPGDGRNNKLNTTPGSRMGESYACWNILVGNSKEEPRGAIEAILSGLSGSAGSHVPGIEAETGIPFDNDNDVKKEKPQSPNEPTVTENVQKDLDDGDNKNTDSDSSGSQGYEQDPEMRKAVELRAVSIAISYYESEGFRVTEYGKPFDLLCERDDESIHVEVKGSRSKLDTVFLTINEVSDAENATWQSDLFVVDQIVVEKIGNDLVGAAGVARVIQKWAPAKEMLAPSEFRYRLPDESQWLFLK